MAGIAGVTVDFPVGRLAGGRMLPSDVSVSAVEVWLRAQPGGGFASPVPSAGGAPRAAGTQAAPAKNPQGFTLSSLPASFWLRAGEKTQMAVASFQLHVLPAVRGETPWDAPVLGMEGSLTGLDREMAAHVVLRNGTGAALIESETDLRLGAETIVSTVAVPRTNFRDMLAFAPPGLLPPGAKVEGAAEIRLHAQAQLPAAKGLTADWDVRVAPGRVTLPALSAPVEFPETRLEGRASLKDSALETTVRLAAGGSAPWAEIVSDFAVDLHSLKGTFTVKSPGADVARLAALVPHADVSFPTALPLKFEAGADFDWPDRAVENLRIKLDLPAGRGVVNGRTVNWPAVGMAVNGRASPGFPESEASIAASMNAALPPGMVTIDLSAAWDGRSGRLRVQSQSTPFDSSLLLDLVPNLPAGTAISLPVSWMFDADIDTRNAFVQRAKAVLGLGAGSLTLPEFLSAPLTTTPGRFEAEITEQGATGKIAPFEWAVGPLVFRSEGGGWTRTGDKLEGGFSLGVGRVKMADCVALLSAKLRAQLPRELAEIGDLALVGFVWHEHITGAWKDGRPVFDRTVADGRLDLALGPEPLSVLAHLEMPVPPKTMHAEITIPDFVQARFRLPLLDRLPVPWLDAPARAQFTVDWEFPNRLKSAQWKVEAGAGRILPRGLLANWLGEPLPLTRFAVGGSVGPDFSRFDIGEFLLESGRARCRFSEFSLDLKPEPDRRRLHVGGQILLENWFAEDFLPLLSRPLRDGLPDRGTALLDLGLQTFSASLDAAIAVDPSGKVVIESMKHDGSCVLRIGDQPLPLKTAAGYDPGAHRVFARAEIVGLRPAQFKPRLANGLPVTLAVFDFPVSLKLEARSTVPEDFPRTQIPPPDVSLAVRCEPGVIRRCDFLAMDTPLRSFELEAESSLAGLTLKSFRAKADFDGPMISVDSLRASFGEAPAAETAVRLSDIPLDWLLARVPGGLLAPEARAVLPKLAVGGTLRSVDLAAGVCLAADKTGKPRLESLHLEGEIEKPSVRWENWPAVECGRIHFASDSETARLEVTDIQAGPLRVSRLQATANRILGDTPTADGAFAASGQLGEIPAFLRSLPKPIALPDGFDWSKLAGELTVQGTFAADLSHLPDPAAVSAEAQMHVNGFNAPAIPGRFETAPGSCQAGLTVKNCVADLQGSLETSLRCGFGVIEGPMKVRFVAHGEMAGRAEATVAVDLNEAKLRAPGLAWEKQAGVESSLEARVATPDFRCAGNAASAAFELAGKGLVYQRFGVKGRVDATLTPGGPPATLKLVCDPIEADATTLRLEAGMVWPQSADVTLSGSRFDLRPLVRLVAPLLAALNAPSEPPGAAAATGTPAAPAPAATAAMAPAPGLPAGAQSAFLPAESKVNVNLQEIVLGGGRTIAPFQLQAQFRGARPVMADLSFASLGHGVQATLRPGPGRSTWSVKIDDIGDLLAVGTAPLKELPAPMTAADTTIGGLIGLPDTFAGGHLTTDGTLDLGNAANLVQGRVQGEGLRFRTEIPILSKIARLVKRDVKWPVPVHEFRIESFTIGQNEAHVQNALMDGPINLTADKIDLDFVTTELFLRGKVWGVWFDIKGPSGKREPYLDEEKNKWIKSITTEDEY